MPAVRSWPEKKREKNGTVSLMKWAGPSAAACGSLLNTIWLNDIQLVFRLRSETRVVQG